MRFSRTVSRDGWDLWEIPGRRNLSRANFFALSLQLSLSCSVEGSSDKPEKGSFPVHILRGSGFTETQIERLPSLLTFRAIEYDSFFISYSHQDEAIAQQLQRDLRNNDIPCWCASHDLRPGSYYREGIDKAIPSQEKVLLLLSRYSVASGWVRHEVELMLAQESQEQREILIPICLDDAIFRCKEHWATSLRASRHIEDFTGLYDGAAYYEALTALLRHLKVSKLPTA